MNKASDIRKRWIAQLREHGKVDGSKFTRREANCLIDNLSTMSDDELLKFIEPETIPIFRQLEYSMRYIAEHSRGGAGRGQGRHPKYAAGPMLHASIRLPAEWQADLRAEFGSLQKAVEALVLAHREGKP